MPKKQKRSRNVVDLLRKYEKAYPKTKPTFAVFAKILRKSVQARTLDPQGLTRYARTFWVKTCNLAALLPDPFREVLPDGAISSTLTPYLPDTDEGNRKRLVASACMTLTNCIRRGTMTDDEAKSLLALADSLDGGKAPARRHRRPPLTPKDRPLTARQAEVVQIVGECKGDLAEAARRLGIDRATLKESYDAGMEKLARAGIPTSAYILKPKTKRLPVDFRGQVAVTKDRRR